MDHLWRQLRDLSRAQTNPPQARPKRFLSIPPLPKVALHIIADRRMPIVLITLLSAVLRAYHLGFKSLWLDEAVIYEISSGSTPELIEANAHHNSAPPLYPLLIRSLSIGIGEGEVALRIGSFAAGVAAIPVVYLLARRIHDDWAGTVASFLAATSVSQVRYSQQLREYSLAVLICGLLLLALIGLTRNPTWPKTWAFMGLAVVGAFTQYGLSVVIIMGLLVWLSTLHRKDGRAKHAAMLIMVMIVVALATATTYSISLRYHLPEGGFAGETYLGDAYWSGAGILSALDFLIANTLGLVVFSHEIGPLLTLLVAIGVAECAGRRRKWTALALLAAPAIAIIALSMVKLYPYHGGRQDIFLAPGIYVLAGIGASRLASGLWRRWAITVLLTVVGLYSLVPRPSGLIWYYRSTTPENSRPVVDSLKANYQPGDAIYSNWLGGYALRYYLRETPEIAREITYLSDMDAIAKSQIGGARQAGTSAWIFLSHCDGSCSRLRDWIGTQDSMELSIADNGVWMYSKQY